MEFVPTDEESTEIKQLAEIKKMAYDLHMKKKENAKIYYLNNKEKYKQYYENRKAKIIVCSVCSCQYFEKHLARHFNTKIHQSALLDKQYFDEKQYIV